MDDIRIKILQLIKDILRVRYTDPKAEIELCKLLLRLSLDDDYDYGIAFAYTYLGDAYMSCTNLSQAVKELDIARTYSEIHGHQDLFLKAHLYTGMCYSMMHDEHSALQHYLISLDLAQSLNDILVTGIIYNNIATIFDKRHDVEEADHYYVEAYKLIDRGTQDKAPTFLPVLLYNLINTSCSLGRLAEAKRYLTELDGLDYPDDTKLLALTSGWHTYALEMDDKQLESEMANKILQMDLENVPDKFFTFEILIPTFEGALKMGNEAYMREILKLMEHLSKEDEPDHQKTLKKFKVQYSEAFASEQETFQAYREFFEVVNAKDEVDDQLITDGLKARIHLGEVTKEKENVQKQNRDLEETANLDEITGIHNRRYFNQLISRAKTDHFLKKVGVIMLDIDYFKQYNDHYGHISGDETLKTVSECLVFCVDGSAIYPCRHGGDEFSCLCLDMEDAEMECYIGSVQRMLENCHIPHRESLCSDYVTLSVGYCNMICTADMDLHKLMEDADQALYQAKSRGRNQYYYLT